MANRHSNKRLRGDVRRRMAATGESYQRALAEIRGERSARGARRGGVEPRVELFTACYFGAPITIAIFEAAHPVGRPIILHIPAARRAPAGASMPLPLLHFRTEGWQ